MENVEMTIKVGVVPGTVKEVVITDESKTRREIFELEDIEISNGYSIRVNGVTADLDEEIGNIGTSATVYATKMIKGN